MSANCFFFGDYSIQHYPVLTQRCFNANTTSITFEQRCMDVRMTLCAFLIYTKCIVALLVGVTFSVNCQITINNIIIKESID